MVGSSVFSPQQGGSFVIANAVASAAGVAVPENASAVSLSNSSATATAFARVTLFPSAADVGSGAAATATTDLPILPLSTVVVNVGTGWKKIRAIASAADGNLYVTPGRIV